MATRANPLIIESALSDGTPVCMRTIRPSDEERIREGILELSERSRYLRFFSAFKTPPPAIVARLSDVDGHDHIGWGALRTDLDDLPGIGTAHAVRLPERDDMAELAVAILDEYQGLGLSKMLIAAVLLDCAHEGVATLEMHVLSENAAAAGLVASLGAVPRPDLDMVAHYELDVAQAIAMLRAEAESQGVRDVIAAFDQAGA